MKPKFWPNVGSWGPIFRGFMKDFRFQIFPKIPPKSETTIQNWLLEPGQQKSCPVMVLGRLRRNPRNTIKQSFFDFLDLGQNWWKNNQNCQKTIKSDQASSKNNQHLLKNNQLLPKTIKIRLWERAGPAGFLSPELVLVVLGRFWLFFDCFGVSLGPGWLFSYCFSYCFFDCFWAADF